MTRYFDMTNTDGCFGVIAENGEQIVFAGVTINAMPQSVRRKEGEAYDEFARRYDIHFIFDDKLPAVDFYTVPRTDIAAIDSDGGFIASVGEPFDLRSGATLVYISKDRSCYLITENSAKFLSEVTGWKGRLAPYDGIRIYDSKDSARKDYDIIDFDKTPEYMNMMQLINKRKSRKGQA